MRRASFYRARNVICAVAFALSFQCLHFAPKSEHIVRVSVPAARAEPVSDYELEARKSLAVLRQKDPSNIYDAVRTLGKRHDRRAVPDLMRLTKNRKLEVRYDAVRGLGMMGDKRACPYLMHSLKDQSPMVRGQAAYALAVMGYTKASPALVRGLGDRDTVARAWMAEALGSIGDAHALPKLKELADKDPNERVRKEAKKAMLSIAGTYARSAGEAQAGAPTARQ